MDPSIIHCLPTWYELASEDKVHSLPVEWDEGLTKASRCSPTGKLGGGCILPSFLDHVSWGKWVLWTLEPNRFDLSGITEMLTVSLQCDIFSQQSWWQEMLEFKVWKCSICHRLPSNKWYFFSLALKCWYGFIKIWIWSVPHMLMCWHYFVTQAHVSKSS